MIGRIQIVMSRLKKITSATYLILTSTQICLLLCPCDQGECVWKESEDYSTKPTGMFIVVRGVVKLMVQAEGKLMPYYMGSGGCGCGRGESLC